MNNIQAQLLCNLRCLWRTQPYHRSLIGGVGLALAAGEPVPTYEQNIVAVLLKAAGLWQDAYRAWLSDVIPQPPSNFEYEESEQSWLSTY